ncbi:MAG: PSD1 and planctomycete cytochrome C domain-containing protein [Gemmataceae bacterium]|nr:PSD1 and planctomycete cytochrome C domain-containing protein [Gemmataceae bacterium]
MIHRRWLAVLAVVCAVACAVVSPSRARAGDGIDFFERKIRPVLVEHCYQCHARDAKKQRGGLLLDSRAGIRKGGDTGPAVVPGKPAESLLLKAVRHVDPELKMPPKGKLPDAVIADLERWIALGAPDPREEKAVKAAGVDFEAATKHWAYQPLRKPALPPLPPSLAKGGTQGGWAATPIDRFILAKLEEKGLTPSPPADPRTLLRRLYFDLTGLPPTSEEVEDFVRAWDAASAKRQAEGSNPRARAMVLQQVVDRLLASPRYGERWGRHWLDVARYADTKDGVLMYGDDRIRPYAYTYRDYVIRAFNDDTPFDRFIHEQLAADLIEPKVEPWRLAAMGYLTLGRMFDNNQHDILDDRIDVVTRGLLGLTVTCARCHDHKYDAVSSADYYALYGVFASSEAPFELPLIGVVAKTPSLEDFLKKEAPARHKLNAMQDEQFALLTETARERIGDYLVRVATTPPDLAETAIYFLSLAPTDLRPQVVNRWRKYLEHPARADDAVFGPWHAVMRLPEADWARRAPATIAQWASKPSGTARGQINPLVAQAFANVQPESKPEIARMYGDLLRKTYERSKQADVKMNAAEQQLVDLLTSRDSPAWFPKSQTYYYMSRQEKDRFGGMRNNLDKLAVQSPHAPPRAMVLHDAQDIVDPRIFVRGNPSVPGEPVARRFLRVLAGPAPKPFANGSGRLDLAKAITAPDNPLTARVLVNRVWMHHFGEPLVSTPSDFGARSTPPTHPELLDWLASTFIEEGWSLKKLHRHIVLSAAYGQESEVRGQESEVRGLGPRLDPENRYLWRMNRRRLDLEAMRDSLLFVSGRLDLTMGGRPVNVAGDAANRRRTVYGLVDRQTLPGLFRAFDFASPDASAERRPFTTVPQQALFGMNSPFIMEQAKALAARPQVAEAATPEAKVAAHVRLALARAAEPGEIEAAIRFVRAVEASGERSQLTPWQQYAQVLLMTNEFVFVD